MYLNSFNCSASWTFCSRCSIKEATWACSTLIACRKSGDETAKTWWRSVTTATTTTNTKIRASFELDPNSFMVVNTLNSLSTAAWLWYTRTFPQCLCVVVCVWWSYLRRRRIATTRTPVSPHFLASSSIFCSFLDFLSFYLLSLFLHLTSSTKTTHPLLLPHPGYSLSLIHCLVQTALLFSISIWKGGKVSLHLKKKKSL